LEQPPEHAQAYRHLAPPLRLLSGDALRIWADTAERARALQAILDAVEGRGDLHAALRRVDSAVESGLAALGLRRGAVPAVLLEAGQPAWAGLTDADATIHLAGTSLRALVSRGAPDEFFRTWVHESLHARGPRLVVAETAVPGYEEGMAEGLARRVLLKHASVPRIEGGFDHYVAGYETLAEVLGLDVEHLWRRLWEVPRGEVRARFVGAVEALRTAGGQGTLSVEQEARLRGAADSVFLRERAHDRPNSDQLSTLWRLALR
jgi:hypothetical protein